MPHRATSPRRPRRRSALLLPLVALLAVACAREGAVPHAAPPAPVAPRAVAFTGARVFDAERGTAAPGLTVLVVGERIAAVGPDGAVELPPDARRVDARGGFLMPGLVDMHTHVTHWGPDALARLVDAGVTTARDMGGDLEQLLGLREAVRRGERAGPGLVLCGPFLEGSRSTGDHRLHVDTPDEARAAVAGLVARGVDFLKLQARIDREVAAAVIGAAHERDLSVAGHVPAGLTAAEAARLGLDSVEHVESLLDLDDAALEATFAVFREQGTAFSPTLFGLQAALAAAGADLDTHPRLARARAVVRRAHEAGVPLLVGSNFAFRDWPQQPGSGLHGELAALVDAGLPPAEVLGLATLGAARFLGRADELGAVRAGMLADLLLIDGDPLTDIRESARVAAVVRRGELLRPGAAR